MGNGQITSDLIGCIICGAAKTVVSDSRPVFKNNMHYTRRKRECLKCNAANWTKEVIDHPVRDYQWSKNRMGALRDE